MAPFIELRPNRDLLDSNFSGYKLSLEPIPVHYHKLETGIEHVLPDDDQYSFLHAKLFGLHNHLYGDPWSTEDVYFIDSHWRVHRNVKNLNNGRLEGIFQVWQIPGTERKHGRYNTSMSFASAHLCIISDGSGTLHLLDTTDRTELNLWTLLFSGEVCGHDKPFVIVDARSTDVDGKPHVHCLVQHVEASSKDGAPHFKIILEWITLAKEDAWTLSSVRKMSGAGSLDYAALEVGCESVYVASEQPFRFIIDSEAAVATVSPMEPVESTGRYRWQQTHGDITVWVPATSGASSDLLTVSVEQESVSVALGARSLMKGRLWDKLEASAATWSLAEDIVELRLKKASPGLEWKEFILDGDGDEVLASDAGDEVMQETEETVPPFNTEQLEECDTIPDLSQLVRLDSHSHSVSHQVHLCGLSWLLTARLRHDAAPAAVLRHDVDGCAWQPEQPSEDKWPWTHVGTFNAFGYVLASKTQRRFTVCAPDLSYAAVFESGRRVFVYRQPSPVEGDLRQRRSGRRVAAVARQQLATLEAGSEVLGAHAGVSQLYVLTGDVLAAMQMT